MDKQSQFDELDQKFLTFNFFDYFKKKLCNYFFLQKVTNSYIALVVKVIMSPPLFPLHRQFSPEMDRKLPNIDRNGRKINT